MRRRGSEIARHGRTDRTWMAISDVLDTPKVSLSQWMKSDCSTSSLAGTAIEFALPGTSRLSYNLTAETTHCIKQPRLSRPN
jgi:hypothetical protein